MRAQLEWLVYKGGKSIMQLKKPQEHRENKGDDWMRTYPSWVREYLPTSIYLI